MGAGAGRHALSFPQQFETVAMESREALVETMRDRGVPDARCVDMFALRDVFDRDRFQSALAAGTQVGLCRSTTGRTATTSRCRSGDAQQRRHSSRSPAGFLSARRLRRGMDAAALAQTYYDAIDDGDYDALREVLAPDFEHVRPDRTLSGREAFVSFMRDGRPRTDTTHVLDAVYEGQDGVAARGRLLGEDGELMAFVDAFEVADGDVVALTTYASSADDSVTST
jgi:ketosteroid isomerase-like protein